MVALTLDDGPDARWTGPVLEVLSRRGVRATFFMLVERAEAVPVLVDHVIAGGHEIGLHGIDHTPLTDIGSSATEVLFEARRRLEAITGRAVRWYRPPFGSQSLGTFRAAGRVGLDVVVWGPEGDDWATVRPDAIAARIVTRTRRGDIVLLHDGMEPEPAPGHPSGSADRAAAVDATISALRVAGLDCVSLGELSRSGRVRRSVWFRPSPDRPSVGTPAHRRTPASRSA